MAATYFTSQTEKDQTLAVLDLLRKDMRRMEGSRKAGVDRPHQNMAAALQRQITPMRKSGRTYRGEGLTAVERKVLLLVDGHRMGTYTDMIATAQQARVLGA
jgi:hypothetical protein